MKKYTLLFSTLCLFGASGQSAAETRQDACAPVATWTSLQHPQGATLLAPAFMEKLSRRQVVLLGENHTSFEHHRWQLQTIAGLHTWRSDLVLGFEMFPRRTQAALDRWVAGKLSEAEFLEQTEWYKVWSYDPALYMPLFHFARMNRIPMVALNVDRSFTSAVRKGGWDAVPESQREGVSRPAPASPGYREELTEVYRAHSKARTEADHDKTADATPDPDDAGFRRFSEGQLTWDRAMAEAINSAVRQPGAPLVIGIMGAGHVMNRYGVPHQLADLGVHDVAVLLAWDAGQACDALTSTIADAVFGIATPAVAANSDKPRLGVQLQDDKDGVRIAEVTPASIAEDTGLRNDDLLLEVAGVTVKAAAEVSKIIQRQAPGTWLPIKIRRGAHTLEVVAKFPAQQ
ncbi:MAG: ChaN family lipoprotein [Gammaproteobacteria bacterium]|nr:ChaN family lipoprotein [Gammaproteobacteria bacterium]